MTHNCFYKDQICHHCGKQGHIQRVCRSKQQGKPKQATKTPEVHAVEVDVDAYEDVLATLEVHNVRKQSNDIIWVDLDVDGKPLKMELDTGSAVSINDFPLSIFNLILFYYFFITFLKYVYFFRRVSNISLLASSPLADLSQNNQSN